MFNIGFRGSPFIRDEENLLLGRLEGFGLHEDFWSPLDYWQEEQYEVQWRQGIQRVLDGKISALIVSMRDPELSNFIDWWLLYAFEDQVIFQNQMLFLQNLRAPFNTDDIYTSIRPYRRHNLEGEALSEWRVPKCALQDFMK
ncbi:hypothetical protein [Variovorax boronicumulans]|uniref:hypothetical protein n=1 Tax=Variovorax boronicumulans TaxID=436515 RepID=UPI00339B7215